MEGSSRVQHVTKASSEELLKKFAEMGDKKELRLAKRRKRILQAAAPDTTTTLGERKSLLPPPAASQRSVAIGKARLRARNINNRSFFGTIHETWRRTVAGASKVFIEKHYNRHRRLIRRNFRRKHWCITEYLNMRIKRSARCRYPYSDVPENVVQTGAAQEGRAGFPNDPVTLTVTEIFYQYKVVLPDVARNLYNLSVGVQYNGQFEVEGIVSSGEITSTEVPVMLNRKTRRIFPPGHFTINFYLPGPADPESVTAMLHLNGVLEGTVLKPGVVETHLNDHQSESSD
ncbi:hypothetical protein K7X08_014756 [Anisodus acutangulus]|uniref:Uncharacterized protein n=1 Tax=Anisodus acutangulus TaxID=402998 RepID=A0A9Q1LIU7_9SOLA|nr:hypothetical protein K7X08_014756 [Anisodus acutangulus]